MQVAVFTDNTLPLPVPALCDLLNGVCTEVAFAAGSADFRVESHVLSAPASFGRLSPAIRAKTADLDLSVFATTVPYEDNYFFYTYGERTIVSFAGWNTLTDLPISNGLVYFMTSFLVDKFDVGTDHEANTGCINDVLWDKRGVDVGMRAAFLCASCRATIAPDENVSRVIADVDAMLDVVSRASRAGLDVLVMEAPGVDSASDAFDAFLCHNSADKPAVRSINAILREAGVKTWLDEDQLEPGVPWQTELEKQMSSVRRAVVLVGQSGFGPWQNAELRGFLSEFVNRGLPVIPVLLPDAPEVPDLPILLNSMTWVDLRHDYDSNLARLIRALRKSNT